MNVSCNNKTIELEEGTTVAQLIQAMKYRRAAVWVNGEQLLAADYDTRIIGHGGPNQNPAYRRRRLKSSKPNSITKIKPNNQLKRTHLMRPFSTVPEEIVSCILVGLLW
jgi:sulfur carrier protein ThiS